MGAVGAGLQSRSGISRIITFVVQAFTAPTIEPVTVNSLVFTTADAHAGCHTPVVLTDTCHVVVDLVDVLILARRPVAKNAGVAVMQHGTICSGT